MINTIANDLVNELPFTQGHIRVETGIMYDYLIVKFNLCTIESNFRNIKQFLESYNYFDEVSYIFSEALNGKGTLTAKIRKE